MSNLKHFLSIDSVEIKRIERIYEKFGDRFINRVYSDEEKKYFSKFRKSIVEHLAGRFSAKEAVIKLVSSILSVSNIKQTKIHSLKDISILPGNLGEPQVVFSNDAKKVVEKLKIAEIRISITHTKEQATAVALGICKED